MPHLWPFRSRLRRDSAWVRSLYAATRPGAGQDTAANPAARLVSKWEERRSKEARSVLAIGLPAAWQKQALCRLLRQPKASSGSLKGASLGQIHFLYRILTYQGICIFSVANRDQSVQSQLREGR